MTATASADGLGPETVAGERVELARYTLPDGCERVLCGARVASEAVVIDTPASIDGAADGGDGRVYLVERDVAADGRAALQALLDDYVASARRLGRVPMVRTTGRGCSEVIR